MWFLTFIIGLLIGHYVIPELKAYYTNVRKGGKE